MEYDTPESLYLPKLHFKARNYDDLKKLNHENTVYGFSYLLDIMYLKKKVI